MLKYLLKTLEYEEKISWIVDCGKGGSKYRWCACDAIAAILDGLSQESH